MLALLFAVVVGYCIGAGEYVLLILFGATAVVAYVATVLQRRAWVLILLGWAFAGQSPILLLPISIRQITILLAVSAYVGFRVLSSNRVRPKFHALDFLVLLNLGWFAVSYLRHPVGFRAFGTETVGGRPYIEAIFAAVAYWILLRMPDSPKIASRIPYLLLVPAVVLGMMNAIGYLFPQAVPRLYIFYANVDLEVYFSGTEGEGMLRFKRLGEFGLALIAVLCAYSPPRKLFNPLRPYVYWVLLGLVCILASGFRNWLLWAVVTMVIAALFYRARRELMLVGVLAGLCLTGLIMGQGKLYHLPLAVQRTLTILPGDWSPLATEDAEGSSRWRFDLWRTIMKEKVIKDWWFGEGIGMQAKDLQTFGHAGQFTEDTLLTGAFHNGPLTTIRCVGIVGLVLLYALMMSAAVYSIQCVQRCRGTPLFAASIFVASFLIWFPIHYAFVFGSFEAELTELIFKVALLRLLMSMVTEFPPVVPSEIENDALPGARPMLVQAQK